MSDQQIEINILRDKVQAALTVVVAVRTDVGTIATGTLWSGAIASIALRVNPMSESRVNCHYHLPSPWL